MSVLVIAKFQGDTAKFRQALQDRAGEFEKFGQEGRSAGALHHRFGVGDGYVVVIDEWDSMEHFRAFFGQPDLQAFIAEIGAEPGSPETITAEAIASPDEF